MSSCPCCGKPLPDTVPVGELCSTCSNALDTGRAMDDGFQPAIRVEDFEPRKPAKRRRSAIVHRPLGVTVLAACSYLASLLLLALAIIPLIWHEPEEASSHGGIATLLIVCSLLSFSIGLGLWTLSEWGRQLFLASAALALLFGQANGLPGVGTRLFNLIFFWYLLKPEIKALFDEDEAPATSSTKPKQLGGW